MAGSVCPGLGCGGQSLTWEGRVGGPQRLERRWKYVEKTKSIPFSPQNVFSPFLAPIRRLYKFSVSA